MDQILIKVLMTETYLNSEEMVESSKKSQMSGFGNSPIFSLKLSKN